MKKKDITGIIIRCIVALALFAVAIWKYDYLSNLSVADIVSGIDNTALIIGIVLGIYFVKALVFVIPASVIYVAVGAILPPWVAVAVNLTGIFIEVSATYILGRFLGKDYVYRLLSSKKAGQKILEKNIQDKASVLIAIRAIPAFPIDWISLFYGAYGCNYIKYALLSVAGISWRVILFTILGDGIFKWIPMDKIILIAICLIPVGIVYYLVKKFVLDPKKKAKEEASSETEASEETEAVSQ